MSDHSGAIIWKAEYKVWGECKAEKTKSSFFENSEIISNNIRFQGQYFDQETGLHYNRHRYYSPYVGSFVSRDPVKLLGGSNIYTYSPSPIGWIDPLGLSPHSDAWEKASGQKLPANMQVDHIIPRALQAKAKAICPGFDLDGADNLIALPTANYQGSIPQSKWYGKTQHQGRHDGYTRSVGTSIRLSGMVKKLSGCKKISIIQNLFRAELQNGAIPVNNIDSKVITKKI